MLQEQIQIQLTEGQYYLIPFKKKFAKVKTMEAFRYNGVDMSGCYCFTSNECGFLRVSPKVMQTWYPTIKESFINKLSGIKAGDQVSFEVNGRPYPTITNNVIRVSETHIEAQVNDPGSILHGSILSIPKATNEYVVKTYGTSVYKILIN